MFEFIKVWTVTETVNEYGSQGEVIGHFTNHAAAKSAANGRGWSGSEADISERSAITFPRDGVTYILADADPVALDVDFFKTREELRASALAKLTPAEKVVLGL